MRKILGLVLFLGLIAQQAVADNRGFIRNDSGAILQGTDLEVSAASVTNKGALLMSMDPSAQFATSPVQLEDASVAESSGVIMSGARRIDALSTNPGTAGDAGFINQSSVGALWVSLAPAIANGESMFLANAMSTTVKAVKASAGQLYSYHCYNPAAAATYIQIFNTASGSVVLGTTTPVLSLGIPAGGAGNLEWPNGLAFSTAISAAATTTATGLTAPATAADCNFTYK